jgi:2-C-methyl-D-erythritol 4-phosphate cytidylyltransferase
MKADRPKQYLTLGGKTVIEHTLDRFIVHPAIAGIVVALDPQDVYWPSLTIACEKPLKKVVGGKERCHSVLNALKLLEDMPTPPDWVAVHDAARPCLTRADLDKLMLSLASDRVGGILGVPVRDTIKYSRDNERIAETVDRAGLWHAMTPQMFRLQVLAEALRRSLDDGYLVTDEASAVEHIDLNPRLIEGRADNIKITRPEDLALAEHYLLSSA